jgi:hypothetical protein
VKDRFTVVLLCAVFVFVLGQAGGEDEPPLPVMPKDEAALFTLLNSTREDIRQAAFIELQRFGKTSAALLNAALENSGEFEKPLLYLLAARSGNARTLEIIAERIRILPFRSFEYVRAMECALALGTEYPLPVDLIPNLLIAWLEGDASFTMNAPFAIRKLGRDALPELIRMLRNNDQDSAGAAIELMLETGILSRSDLERICRTDPISSDVALDVLAAYFNDFQAIAGEMLASETAGLTARRNAIWWLVYSGKAPSETELHDIIENCPQTLAAEAALSLDYCYPEIAFKHRMALLTGKEKLTSSEAACIAVLPTQESVRTMMLAQCMPDAVRIRDLFKEKLARDSMMSTDEFIRVFCPSLATTERYAAARFYRIAQVLSRTYNIDCAAQACSRSLMQHWDRQAAAMLCRLMAEYPDLDARLFLSPYFKQRSREAHWLIEADDLFAQALMGSFGGYRIVEDYYRGSSEAREQWSKERFVN